MKVRMFKPQFVPMLQNGTKTTTIRAKPWQVGETYSARYWSARPYNSPQIAFGTVKVLEASPISLTNIDCLGLGRAAGIVASCDGFSGWQEMRAWFQKNHHETFVKHGHLDGWKMTLEFKRIA
jgi:hypothetical protein